MVHSRSRMYGFVFFLISITFSNSIFAAPSGKQVYRNESLNLIVYSDSNDKDVFWYLPPLRLYEENGKVVYYRFEKKKDGKLDHYDYYFYVVPYMTNDLMHFMKGEMVELRTATQLRPVTAKRFGVQVKLFEASSLGEAISDYQYLNKPHTLRLSVPVDQVEEFEFLLSNKPGIQAEVHFSFESIKLDKWVDIKLSHKEVYKALNIGGNGRYVFTRAEIEGVMSSYLTRKHMEVSTKGDLPVPEIINRVIEECFTPVARRQNRPGSGGWDDDRWRDRDSGFDPWDPWVPRTGRTQGSSASWGSASSGGSMSTQTATLNEKPAAEQKTPTEQAKDDQTKDKPNKEDQAKLAEQQKRWQQEIERLESLLERSPYEFVPYSYWNEGPPDRGAPQGGILFAFRPELANSDKDFYYKHHQYADYSETVAVPIYLSKLSERVKTKMLVEALPRNDLVVMHKSTKQDPLKTKIRINANEQYIIQAAFSLQAESPYAQGVHWYRWESNWPSPDEDLYYRLGSDGHWVKVNGRAVVQSDTFDKGELQFYLDREKLWEKVPEDWKKHNLFIYPPRWVYKKWFPQFSVTITGRRFQIN